MKHSKAVIGLIVVAFLGCKSGQKEQKTTNIDQTKTQIAAEFTFVFASCNDQDRTQPLWESILESNPELFIWGGDNIYADTANMQEMQGMYNKQFNQAGYATLRNTVPVIGTWDDHDYGKNDAGIEWTPKAEAQQLFLDFLEIPKNDSLRTQEGVYYKHEINTAQGRIQFLLLDTRYFRSPLLLSSNPNKRYDSWPANHKATILGNQQWSWLEKQLQNSAYDFTFIVSSIQFLNQEHGWERWGIFPSEVDKFYKLLQNAKATNIILLSGDRHLAEVSVNQNAGLPYPLVDFTSSGLTHTYPDSPMLPNKYRVGRGSQDLNFGLIRVDFTKKQVHFEIRGVGNSLDQLHTQQY